MIKPLRVIVTAGGSGIGYAIAQVFHSNGHRVYVCDINEQAIAQVREALPGIGACCADVGDSAQVKSLFEKASETMQGLDVLVNNAGVGGPCAPLEEVSDEDWLQTINVNLNGTFYCMREAARIMKAQHSGCIINISSASATTGLPQRGAYVASKHAVQGLTLNCARELGPSNISCNAILPGAIDNERGHALVEKKALELDITIAAAEQRRLSYISMRKRIDPAEIGQTALFLATEGRNISGQLIGVCGNSEWEP
ncbi:MAG: SDR family oxidoreductase [Halieaceae bacterium]|nr:SDR family oxidoreductase [Halieaceae bacterium]